MKSILTLSGVLLIATTSVGAQATKTPPKPDSSKAPAATKAPVTQPGAKQAAPPATKAADTKAADTKAADTKTVSTKAGDTKQVAGQGTKAPGTKAPDTKAPPAQTPALNAAQAAQLRTPTIYREVYAYDQEGRRDPFISLLSSSTLRPTVADLRLTGILYDENGTNSIAMMRDILDNKQYRVIAGQTLGRMKVALIKRRVVIFSIEEFGMNRQDSLVLGDTTKVRKG